VGVSWGPFGKPWRGARGLLAGPGAVFFPWLLACLFTGPPPKQLALLTVHFKCLITERRIDNIITSRQLPTQYCTLGELPPKLHVLVFQNLSYPLHPQGWIRVHSLPEFIVLFAFIFECSHDFGLAFPPAALTL